jgi:hypothetical protein
MSNATISTVGTDSEAPSADWRNWAVALWHGFERRLVAASDWLNPILVKETRQALKSWQFALTFVLLLVACWIVTIGGVALIGPSVYYAAGGGELLRAFYFILAFPLLVVVPFAAFRSLASEREDNTYDLLSITALRPRQIIGGKLGSAIVQMAVYFSAVTPCLAFTYLLRGVDVPTILLLVFYTFVTSLALSMLGLLLATLTRQRYNQVILSVALVALLLLVFSSSQQIANELIRTGFSQFALAGGNYVEFWLAQGVGAAIFASTFILAYLAAAAMISFSTENRSTPLRVMMLVQQATLIGCASLLWTFYNLPWDAMFVVALAGGAYWWLMGSMLTGERSEMSRRAERSLPQSRVGRVFLTWLNPGASTGYMFVVANLLAVFIITMFAAWLARRSVTITPTFSMPADFARATFVGFSFVIGYLGIGCLVISWLRRVTQVTMFAGVLIHFLLVLAGSGIPTTFQLMSVDARDSAYSYWQVTNPFWTVSHLLTAGGSSESMVLAIAIPAVALCVWLLNLPGIVREFRRERKALPARVVEDEAVLHPPPESLPQNPWEAEEAGVQSRGTRIG